MNNAFRRQYTATVLFSVLIHIQLSSEQTGGLRREEGEGRGYSDTRSSYVLADIIFGLMKPSVFNCKMGLKLETKTSVTKFREVMGKMTLRVDSEFQPLDV